ncbi:cytochrome c oxidase assembly protein [Ferdinandcohnia quinoae]|uniref:Cytochrome c oxidase assembly protein n=1 Tax=Fredinandcohnia quinoae TaxID=2918902 RepID=A0AAW5E589_9BACI|nr:cytochrome c oxidase assembly protein [Fredinandcohnia sp. SECRCQ15]MCH1625227.1 cytochrome c oxidase assembly protein [Fredinandcohnia sp. SECRCQ15]
MERTILFENQPVWNIPLLIGLICVTVLFTVLVKYYTNIKIKQKQPLLFIISILIFYLMIGSPISVLSHISFSTHMIQMSILYFVVPPLLLIGIPELLFQRVKEYKFLRVVAKIFLPSTIALLFFATLFFMYHLPVIIEVLTQNSLFHNGYMGLLFVLSFQMWWPIVAPDPKQRFCNGSRKRYILLSGMILMPACVLFIFNDFIGGIGNPLLMKVTAQLCIPGEISSINLPQLPIDPKFDQPLAGILMLGIHKIGMMVTFYFGKRIQNQQEESPCVCGTYFHYR